MKLEGSLDAFSLPDVFQLLSFTKKSGGLHLAQDGSDGVVFLAGGQVTGASADSSRQPLARRLVGSGTVSDEALAAAVETATSGEGVGVVRALLEQGVMDADLLRRAATDQAVDAVFDLLRWHTGDFAFVMDEANPDEVGVALTVEEVLADAEARRVAWESVSEVVPSPRAVLSMPVVLPADPQVSREEWALLALVDGRRTVTELVDLTGSGQYAVVSTLAALVQRGLLEVRPDTGEGEDHVTVVVRRQRLLAPLEGEPFVPVQEVAGRADAGRRGDDSGRIPLPIRPVLTATDTCPTLTPGPTRYPMTPDRRRADFGSEDVSIERGLRRRRRARAGDRVGRHRAARRCSAEPTCRRTSCRRGPSRSCRAGRRTSTTTSPTLPPYAVRCRCRPGRRRRWAGSATSSARPPRRWTRRPPRSSSATRTSTAA